MAASAKSSPPQHSAPGEASAAARRVAHSPWVGWLARLGLAARGVVYLLIGVLALQIAIGHGGKASDQNGALRTVAGQPFGKGLLWLMALGFAGYALWRFTEVAYGETGGDSGAGGRVKSAFRGLAYASICYTTVSLLTGTGSAKGGSASQNQTLSAKAMQHGWGRIAVGVAGLALLAVGLGLIVEGVQKKFEKYLQVQQMSATTRTIVERLGMVGTAARGFVFAVAGCLLATAAVTFDPHKARGLDGALRSLARTPLGPWLLIVVALGLLAFGCYGLAESKYRRTSNTRA